MIYHNQQGDIPMPSHTDNLTTLSQLPVAVHHELTALSIYGILSAYVDHVRTTTPNVTNTVLMSNLHQIFDATISRSILTGPEVDKLKKTLFKAKFYTPEPVQLLASAVSATYTLATATPTSYNPALEALDVTLSTQDEYLYGILETLTLSSAKLLEPILPENFIKTLTAKV